MKILDEIKSKAEAVIESRYAFADVERLHIALSAETVLAMIDVVEAAIIERKKMIDIWPEPLDDEDTERLSKSLEALRNKVGGEDEQRI